MTRRLVVEADGGSRGNPGVAGYGALVRDFQTGDILAERAEPLGKVSNNVAEYRGLISGLEAAERIHAGAHISVRMDSKLVVEQMAGRWKIKHEDMRDLAAKARAIVERIRDEGGSVEFSWIPREQNKEADRLSNVAMDGHTVEDYRDFSAAPSGSSAPPSPAAAAEPDMTGGRDATTPPGAPSCRLLFVAHGGGEASVAAAARLVAGLDARLVSADATDATTKDMARALGVAVEPEQALAGEHGSDDALARLVATQGVLVAVASTETIRSLLVQALSMPPTAGDRLVLAPGSLSAVEAWGPDALRVAFVNRVPR